LQTIGATVGVVAVAAIVGVVMLWQVAPADAVNAQGETVLFQRDTQYHRISVTEDEATRHLRFDNSRQSAILLDDPFESRILYPDYMHLALAANPDAERVLVLGLGGGAITKRYWRDYPAVRVDSVEIDPVVADVAGKYFWLPQDERLETFVEDARRYVQRTNETYDIVIVDAYYSDSLPFHLTTQEFLAEVDDVLAPDGVLAYNVISSAAGDGSDLFRSMYRTAGGVWDELFVFPIGYGADRERNGEALSGEQRRNIIVLATNAALDEKTLLGRIENRVDGRVSINGFERFGDDLYNQLIPLADVPVLTDSHAPTDSLIEVQ
nr:fused MFS/spermidine synthase [Actinomycetota bacterium]